MARRRGKTKRSGVVRRETLPGGRRTERVYEADPDGRPVVHPRTVDAIGRMLRRGLITPAMHDAARDFHAAFTIAGFESLRALPLDRVPGGGGGETATEALLAARRRVRRAMDALGGAGGPAGNAVWYVVGLELSVHEWALREGWGGRPLRHDTAQGILVSALGVLAAHYGYTRGGEHFAG